MLIDWFTVAAQVLNFVVLVWLMKRFLYRPILRAIAAREQLIAAQLAAAAGQKAEAQRERAEFEAKNQAFEAQRASLLSEAVAQVQLERQRLLESARQAAATMSAKHQQALRNDADKLNQALAQRVQHEVFAIARKALADLADCSLEERLVAVFIEQLQGLEASAQQQLAEAIALGTEPVLLRSAFELPAAQRRLLQDALNHCFAGEIALRFERKAELLGGIELSCNGQRLAWSISDYLQALQQGVDELLQAQPTAATQP
ncbi:F0F1 ATP synthase subunit B [Pseudomonas sp. SA3-5]|uniref:ATP synthase subunit b n=1 Tax=Pseudomonas aestuarii TaxID=3018340 RepID=A0ABT4XLG6_9PSED|nr:F0F1 ATP synthase subunit B [Pseudomonas aestuarii]MDA7089043.1 F0F1 ATP synthase subunit B [Pseudomonas aestuarii]